mgnify:CR=1 FL=1|jgi:predicted enzyme related to lactoylglutathione lyase
MNLFGICLITEDVNRLSSFYQAVLQTEAEGSDVHVTLQTESCGLAIYDRGAAERDMGFDFRDHWGTGGTTLMFRVADVDAEFERLQPIVPSFMTTPTTYPWGARAFHFRDPDGNIVDFVTPPNR